MLHNFTIMIDDDYREMFCEEIDKINNNLNCMNINSGEKTLQYLKDEMHVMPDFIF